MLIEDKLSCILLYLSYFRRRLSTFDQTTTGCKQILDLWKKIHLALL